MAVGPKNWVVLGSVLASFGYFLAASLLLGSPENFIAWSLLAVGLLVAAFGLRSLPVVGALPVLGFLIAAIASGFELALGRVGVHQGDLILFLSTTALLLGMAAATWASWRARVKGALKPGDSRALAAGFLLGALGGGAGYLVIDGLAGAMQFLVADALVLIGLSLAAWKIRAVPQSS